MTIVDRFSVCQVCIESVFFPVVLLISTYTHSTCDSIKDFVEVKRRKYVIQMNEISVAFATPIPFHFFL